MNLKTKSLKKFPHYNLPDPFLLVTVESRQAPWRGPAQNAKIMHHFASVEGARIVSHLFGRRESCCISRVHCTSCIRLWSGRSKLWLDEIERKVHRLHQSWRNRLAGCAVSGIIIHPVERLNVNPGRVVIETAAGVVRRRFHAAWWPWINAVPWCISRVYVVFLPQHCAGQGWLRFADALLAQPLGCTHIYYSATGNLIKRHSK